MSRAQIKLNDSASIPLPCQNCEVRTVGCHATCDGYKAYRAEADRRMEARHQRHEDREISFRAPWKGSRIQY